MPSSAAARTMRMAISPRLATSSRTMLTRLRLGAVGCPLPPGFHGSHERRVDADQRDPPPRRVQLHADLLARGPDVTADYAGQWLNTSGTYLVNFCTSAAGEVGGGGRAGLVGERAVG